VDFGIFTNTPKVSAWRSALMQRESVQHAVSNAYSALLRHFLLAKESALAVKLKAAA
jgi:glutathione S-transferase